MNITFIPNSYLPRIGGVELCTQNLCKYFLNKGHKVNVITNLYPRNSKSHEVIDGVSVDRLPFYFLSPYKSSPLFILVFIHTILMAPLVLFRLWRLLRRHKTELVNIQYADMSIGYVLLLSYFYKFRLVISLQGFSFLELPFFPGKHYWVYSRILRKADYITSCSRVLLEDNQKMFPDIKSKSSVIPNGVDLEVFELKDKYHHRRPYIFTLGRFRARQKGFDILFMAFKDILDKGYNIDLIIAGEGYESKFYKRIIDLLKIEDRVALFGLANRREVVSLFNGCEFFVLPSRFEPFGMVNLEAMAAGKAILATDTCGVSEIVKDGLNGILVKSKQVKPLAEGMMRLLDDVELRNRLGDNGKSMVRDYNWEKITPRYSEAFQKAMDNSC